MGRIHGLNFRCGETVGQRYLLALKHEASDTRHPIAFRNGLGNASNLPKFD